MDERASTDGFLNYEGVPTDGFSHPYLGDIEIKSQNVGAIQIYNGKKYEDLVA